MSDCHSDARRPFLMNFTRRKPALDVQFHYDHDQLLNIEQHSGIAVVLVEGAKAMLKTQSADVEE
jgi:hypothetical protein